MACDRDGERGCFLLGAEPAMPKLRSLNFYAPLPVLAARGAKAGFVLGGIVPSAESTGGLKPG